MSASQPAWQTDELKDEWPDELDDNSEPFTRSISFTIPVGSLHTSDHSGPDIDQGTGVVDVPGTFLIRGDALPVLPQKTPGQRKGLIRDFFSPIPLERIFDPPSPRCSTLSTSNPSTRNNSSHSPQLSPIPISSITSRINGQNTLGHPDSPHVVTGDSWRPNMHCPFTFTAPNPAVSTDIVSPRSPKAKNIASAVPPAAPLTDPPLRLFQFQYDTFTRDHLSAMVDSIAFNSPSGSNTGNFLVNTSSPSGLPSVSEASAQSSSNELRSAKRVKLSPGSDLIGFNSRTPCSAKRPLYRKDYIGESRSLMAHIKNARDFSFLSTATSVSSAPQPDPKDHLSCKNGVGDDREYSSH
jgi:protein NUD1